MPGVLGELELIERPIVGGEEEHRDGDPASIAAAEADPEVVMGRGAARPRRHVQELSRVAPGAARR